MRREMPIKAKPLVHAHAEKARPRAKEEREPRFAHDAIVAPKFRKELTNSQNAVDSAVEHPRIDTASEKTVVLPEPEAIPTAPGDVPRDAEASAPIKDRSSYDGDTAIKLYL